MNLLIVESPKKIATIEKLLGKGYKVEASIGHIMDLEKSYTSYEITDNFNPTYVVNSDKLGVVKNLKSASKKATNIFIATDEDREGEMIGYNVAQILNLKNAKRITFIEITEQAIKNAIKNPRQIDNNLVNAQKTRRILDMMIGFKLSPLLGKNFGQYNLSAGRVQSVVARLIIDKENEINKFMSEPLKSFFKFKAVFLSEGKPFTASLYDMEGKNAGGFYKGSQSKIENNVNAKKFLSDCMESTFKVMHVFDKERTQGPTPPFTTSTLQQEANRKLNFTGKTTMGSAQRLYEAGYITYMRTDSVNLSEEALENIKNFVVETYGENFYRRVAYKSKTKNTQEAHEAIRPTDINTTEIEIGGKIGYNEQKLYSMIWKKTVASQMKPAVYNVTSIQISISKDSKHFYMTTLENLTFAGFLSVYNVNNTNNENDENDNDNENKNDDLENDDTNKNVKVPKVGTEISVSNMRGNQDYVRPPGRYNYASLTDKLDPKNLNIGRPATYVSIVEKITEKEYVKLIDLPGVEVDSLELEWKNPLKIINESANKIVLCKEKNKYVPTHLGIMVTYYLIKNFSKIMDYQFTAQMEEKLDDIACGNLEWNTVLKEFYDEFNPLVMNITFNKPDIETNLKLLGIEPKSGFELYVTIGKYGPIYKLMSKPGKPKIAPINEPLTIETATLEDACKAFEYPKELGKYNKKKIQLQTGQFGFYLIYGTQKISVGDKCDVTLGEAIEAIKEKENQKQTKEFGTFTHGTKVYVILDGKFGKYIKITDIKTKKNCNVSLPKTEDVTKLTIERINEIISAHYNKSQVNSNAVNTIESTKNKPKDNLKIIKPNVKTIPNNTKSNVKTIPNNTKTNDNTKTNGNNIISPNKIVKKVPKKVIKKVIKKNIIVT